MKRLALELSFLVVAGFAVAAILRFWLNWTDAMIGQFMGYFLILLILYVVAAVVVERVELERRHRSRPTRAQLDTGTITVEHLLDPAPEPVDAHKHGRRAKR